MLSHPLSRIAAYLPEASVIQSHPEDCCRTARAWLIAMDCAGSFREGQWDPPLWLRELYEWGPTQWPLHICSLPEAKVLDCGALAATALLVMQSRGNIATSVQVALRYPLASCEQWALLWKHHSLDADWIADDICYHEVCGIVRNGELELWDPTDNRWIEPPTQTKQAYGQVLALRVTHVPGYKSVTWGHWSVSAGEWQVVS